jgi:hypothetical protein
MPDLLPIIGMVHPQRRIMYMLPLMALESFSLLVFMLVTEEWIALGTSGVGLGSGTHMINMSYWQTMALMSTTVISMPTRSTKVLMTVNSYSCGRAIKAKKSEV